MNGSVRVAVVARSEVARAGLAHLLGNMPRVVQCILFAPDEFTPPAREDAVQLLVLSCDVLVLWCTNGHGAGADAWAADLASIARRNGIRVALLLPFRDTDRAGSAALVPCDAVLDQNALTTSGLDEALRRLAEGESVPAPVAASEPPTGAVPAAAPNRGAPIGRLTEREQQVLELLAKGFSNKQIGLSLGMSEHAAKRVVALLMSKLHSPNRTQVVAVALREGLLGMGQAPHG